MCIFLLFKSSFRELIKNIGLYLKYFIPKINLKTLKLCSNCQELYFNDRYSDYLHQGKYLATYIKNYLIAIIILKTTPIVRMQKVKNYYLDTG